MKLKSTFQDSLTIEKTAVRLRNFIDQCDEKCSKATAFKKLFVKAIIEDNGEETYSLFGDSSDYLYSLPYRITSVGYKVYLFSDMYTFTFSEDYCEFFSTKPRDGSIWYLRGVDGTFVLRKNHLVKNTLGTVRRSKKDNKIVYNINSTAPPMESICSDKELFLFYLEKHLSRHSDYIDSFTQSYGSFLCLADAFRDNHLLGDIIGQDIVNEDMWDLLSLLPSCIDRRGASWRFPDQSITTYRNSTMKASVFDSAESRTWNPPLISPVILNPHYYF